MKVIRYVLLFWCVSLHAYKQSAITFEGGGMTGDRLKHYYRAKWLAYTHDVPFVFTDLSFLQYLVLAQEEPFLSEDEKAQFKHIKTVNCEDDLHPIEPHTLYVVTSRVKIDGLSNAVHASLTFNQQPAFLRELQRLIAPIIPIEKIEMPEGVVSVAVHVRRSCYLPLLQDEKENVRWQTGYADVVWPKRFPPDGYYIREIRRVYDMMGKRPMYVHIFTDTGDHKKIAKKYQEALNLPNVTFGYRQSSCKTRGWTPSQDYVLDDLFAMTQFDCLVRSSSGYSGLASIIGNHKIVIVPKRAGWFDDVFRVDSVWIVERHANGTITKTGWEDESVL